MKSDANGLGRRAAATTSKGRRTARAAFAAAALATLARGRTSSANTPDYYTGMSTNGTPYALDDQTNWSLGTVPTIANDAVIDNSNTVLTAAATLTFNSSTSATQTFGSLNDASPYAITLENAMSNASGGTPTVTLTLGGGGSSNAYAPATSDLLYVAANSTLTTLNSTSSSVGYGSLNIALGQSGTFDIAGAATINGAISGAYAITKTGAGTLTLNTPSSYSGGTIISGGIVYLASSATAAGTGAVTINAGGTLELHTATIPFANATILNDATSTINVVGTYTTNLSGGVSGSGTLNKTGTGILILPTSNSYTGGTIITGGTVDFTAANSTANAGGTTSAGTGNVSIGSAGTLQFHFPNFSGSARNLSNAVVLTSATSAIESGTTTLSDSFTLLGTLSGPGTLNKTGVGFLYVSPASGTTNTYSGGTNISSGTVDFTTIRGLPTLTSNAGPITMAAGTTFEYDGSGGTTNTLNTFNISGASTLNITGTLSLYGIISGSGQLVKTGSSNLTLIAENAGTTILAANTYTGGTNISSGTLELYQVAYELPSTGTVLIEKGATLEFYNTSSQSTSALTLPTVPFMLTSNTSGGNTTILTQPATAGATASTLVLPGTVSGAGTLVKTGTAGLSLTAANAYTGGTNLSAGTLFVNNTPATGLGNTSASGTGTGQVTINAGTLSGTGAVAGLVVLTAAGTIAAGSTASTIGTLTTGMQTWNGGTYSVKFSPSAIATAGGVGDSGTPGTANDLLVLNGLSVSSTGLVVSSNTSSLASGTSYSFVIAEIPQASVAASGAESFSALVASKVTLATASQSQFSAYSFTDATDGSSDDELVFNFTTAAAPEPTSLLLAAIAAVPLALGRRRRRNTANG